ncbi:MAG: hypothetical protein LUE11_04230 [Clostridia bacterium]|nr:hypothetical protein [Clostridia bacterium]
MKKIFSKKMIMLLTCLLLTVVTPSAMAAVPPDGGTAETQASRYLSSHLAYIDAVGSGKIEIWFSVGGVGTMDKIGATTIVLKQSSDGVSWTTVKTFKYTSYSNMLGANKMAHTSYVSYSGVKGRYYQATVTVYAEKDGGCDSRLKTTSVVKAS